MGNKAAKSPKAFVPSSPQAQAGNRGSPRPEDLFSHDELKSARLVALKGPFVDERTGDRLAKFYEKYAPEKGPEDINKIIQSGMEVSLLNDKLREKYGFDLNDFAMQQQQEKFQSS